MTMMMINKIGPTRNKKIVILTHNSSSKRFLSSTVKAKAKATDLDHRTQGLAVLRPRPSTWTWILALKTKAKAMS